MQVIIPTITTDGSFTRASSGTYINSDGILVTVGNDVMRIGYDLEDTTLPPNAVIENAATNLLKYSEEFDNSIWTKTGCSVAVNSTIGPDGLYTSDKLVSTSADGYVFQLVPALSSTVYSFSIYIRSDTSTTASLFISDTVGGTGNTQVICSVTTNWQRFTVTRTTGATTTQISCHFGGANSFSTGESVYIWGAQLELGSVATSYISSAETFTSRASTATYTNSSGLLASSAINVARQDYNPNNLELGSKLLLENAATNLALQSEVFSNATWSKVNSTATADTTVSPDGTTTADTLTSTGADGYLGQSVTSISALTAYTFSVWLKSASPLSVAIALQDNSAGSPTTTVVCSLTSSWQRFSVTRMTAATATGVAILIGTSGTFTTGEVIQAWGAQLELGYGPTSYIPTTTTSVTRSADISSSANGTRAADVVGNGLLYSNVVEPEVGYPAWNSATAYTVGQLVTYLHRRYKALVAGTNKNPLTDTTVPAYWLDIGPTNRYAMFDDVIGTITENTSGNITVVIKNGAVSGISLMQMNAEKAQISVSLDNIVQYQATLDLISGVILDWWEYFNEEIERVTDFVLTDLPGAASGITTIVISSSAGSASIGNLVMGDIYSFVNTGSSTATTTAPSVGITDYGVKIVDDFGNTKLLPRGYAKRMNCKLMLDSESVDKAVKTLTSVRAKNCVWIGAGNTYECMIVFGYYKDWEVEIAYTTKSYCSLQIEGLI